MFLRCPLERRPRGWGRRVSPAQYSSQGRPPHLGRLAHGHARLSSQEFQMPESRSAKAADNSSRMPQRNRGPAHTEDEDLDRYALGSATPDAEAAIEEHLLVCEDCRERLIQTETLISACRGLRKALESGPRDCIHITPSDAVKLFVTRDAEGQWVAYIAGHLLPGRYTSWTDANLHVDLAFARFFPNHTCSTDCRPLC